MIVQVRPETTQVKDPGEEVAVYSVTALPPISEGAVHVSVTSESAGEDTAGVPGEPGTDSGITALETELAVKEAPAALVVFTVNV
jgi:hypothetical protein